MVEDGEDASEQVGGFERVGGCLDVGGVEAKLRLAVERLTLRLRPTFCFFLKSTSQQVNGPTSQQVNRSTSGCPIGLIGLISPTGPIGSVLGLFWVRRVRFGSALPLKSKELRNHYRP